MHYNRRCASISIRAFNTTSTVDRILDQYSIHILYWYQSQGISGFDYDLEFFNWLNKLTGMLQVGDKSLYYEFRFSELRQL